MILRLNISNYVKTHDFHDHSRDDDIEDLIEKRPWLQEPKYFKRVVISAQTLLKMASHARAGGNIEVMGLLQGRIRGDAFLLTDCFRLPVEGTETRVNAGESANEYMVEFTELNEETRFSNDLVCGWYHSHPGYGCWLSGIDVATQSLYQGHQDPFVAIVIDPLRSAASGRVEIGAFRAYPPGYTESGSINSESSGIPREKIEDFGVHCDRYYSLEVEIYTSAGDAQVLESLWKMYWTRILSEFRFADERQRFAKELTLATAKCKAGKDFASFSRNIQKCSCSFLNQALREYLQASVFRVPGKAMDIN
jgi:COP9 signalosome complex subunit 5